MEVSDPKIVCFVFPMVGRRDNIWVKFSVRVREGYMKLCERNGGAARRHFSNICEKQHWVDKMTSSSNRAKVNCSAGGRVRIVLHCKSENSFSLCLYDGNRSFRSDLKVP